MITAWLLFPLVMLAVCLGCGLTVERIAGWRLSGAVLLAVGLALVMVLATLTTNRSDTAPLTTWLVVIVAVVGYATSWRRVCLLRPEPWTAAIGLGIFAIGAAPVVLSGNATFLGYFVDSDTAFHLVLISELLDRGRDLSHLPTMGTDTVAGVLREYVGTAYPTGADVGVGALRPLVGQDVAWIYQPYLAVTMALGGIVLDELLDGVVRSRPFRAMCAFIAAQAGLTYAFYLQGGIKEIAIAVLITLAALLVIETLRQPFRVRILAPLIVVAVAELDVYSISVVPWLGPPLAVLGGVLVWRARGMRRLPAVRELLVAPLAAVIALGLAAPALAGASTFVTVATKVLTQTNELGDLAAPLSLWHIFGIWPSGDFRYAVQSDKALALILLLVALLAAIAGLAWIIRRRAYAPLLLLGGDLLASAYLLSRASPYAASKVMMILSTAVVMTSMLGAVALHDTGRRVLGWTLAALLGAGVLWTNALAYHDSAVLPQGRFEELAAIGHRFQGHGPAFYDLWDTFPVYFLREVSVAVPNTFAGPATLRPGQAVRSPGQLDAPWDPNDLALSFLQSYRLLVLARSPLVSRPPANYALAYQGRYFDVWKRKTSPQVLDHRPLTYGAPETGPPAPCPAILQTAARARRLGGHLAFVIDAAPPTLIPSRANFTHLWSAHTAEGESRPNFLFLGQQAGTLTGTVYVPTGGRYRVWLQGSLSRPVSVRVDGHPVGTVSNEIGSAGQFNELASLDLSPGPATVRIVRPASGLGPGNVASGELLGPLVLEPQNEAVTVHEVAASRARSLCGRRLQWLEIVR
jgi:hypothetical protein